MVAECTFDRDSCSWRNTSTGDFEWRMATLNRRPSNLPDKTFGAPVGYAYFDIFNSGSRLDIINLCIFKIFILFNKTDVEFHCRLLSYYLNQILRQNRVKMISPTIPGGDSDSMCFSFW